MGNDRNRSWTKPARKWLEAKWICKPGVTTARWAADLAAGTAITMARRTGGLAGTAAITMARWADGLAGAAAITVARWADRLTTSVSISLKATSNASIIRNDHSKLLARLSHNDDWVGSLLNSCWRRWCKAKRITAWTHFAVPF
jgi:hypothetical protein